MSLTVKGVKSNPKRSYALSAATVAAHPVALINKFTSGKKVAARDGVKRLPSKRGERAGGRKTDAGLRGVARTIVP